MGFVGVVIANDESSSDWSLGLVSLPNDSSYGFVGSVAFVGMVRITANKRTISIKKPFFENFAMLKVLARERT